MDTIYWHMNATKGGATLAVYIQTLNYRNFKKFQFHSVRSCYERSCTVNALKKQGILLNCKRHRKKKNQKDTCVFFYFEYSLTLYFPPYPKRRCASKCRFGLFEA